MGLGSWQASVNHYKTSIYRNRPSRAENIPVKLPGETQTSADTAHNLGDDVIQVVERRLFDLECPLGHIIERLVVDTERHITVLDQLVNRE